MDEAVIQSLRDVVGDEACSTRPADLYTYGFDASIYHRSPDMVIQPRSTEQVAEIMKIAQRHGLPVIPRGGGTGLCGSAVPIKGGLVLDMSRMDRIVDISVGDLCCVVEAGCVYQDLNDALTPHGFWFPPTPGSSDACQIGGMVACNASGMKAVKYGATRDYVLGLTFVTADGQIVRAGTRTLKDSSGYQLARLMVGSEGTLGVITEVTLKIAARPKDSAMVLAAFPDLESAGRCVAAIIAKPLIPSSLELMDRVSIDAVNKALGNPLPDCQALCLIEVDGEPEVVDKELKVVAEVARAEGADDVVPTRDKALMGRWNASRKAIMTSLAALRPGHSSVSLADDMVLPISQIPAAVAAYQEIADRNDVTVATYGHAADGNLHTKMLLDPCDADSWRRGEKAVDEIFAATLALGGSVTGEHGVGISKAPNFQRERESVIPVMVAIKKAMDPNNILNPGKLDQWEGSILRNLRYPCPEFQD